ncbi:MAG: hypothetical protein KC646_12665 [Candidatus Cloacimonetes bacterium]|nr:hypothetical protein [Candidatus Cloacimonadota bacterium]
MKALFLFFILNLSHLSCQEQQNKGQFSKVVFRVLESFSNDDFQTASKYFSSRFNKKHLIQSLQQTWALQELKYGPYQEIIFSDLEHSTKGVSLKTLIQMKRSKLALKFTFTASKTIRAYQFINQDQIQIPKYKTPPYVKPKKFYSELLELGGTISPIQAKMYLPKSSSIKNTLIFLHDFGPRDMYHRDGVNSYYRDMAEGLASNSIASVLYDKRSFSYKAPKNSAFNPGWEILRDLYGVIFKIKSHPKLQNTKVTVILNGFSTYLTSYLANQKVFDQFILLNPSFRHPLKTLFEKEEFFLANKSNSESELLKLHNNIQQFFENENLDYDKLFFNYPVSYFRSLEKYSPKQIPKQTQANFLLLSAGEAYSQNPSDIPLIHDVLKKQKVTEHKFPELNHIFHVGKVLQTNENIHTQGIVSARVILIIKDWLENPTQ